MQFLSQNRDCVAAVVQTANVQTVFLDRPTCLPWKGMVSVSSYLLTTRIRELHFYRGVRLDCHFAQQSNFRCTFGDLEGVQPPEMRCRILFVRQHAPDFSLRAGNVF